MKRKQIKLTPDHLYRLMKNEGIYLNEGFNIIIRDGKETSHSNNPESKRAFYVLNQGSLMKLIRNWQYQGEDYNIVVEE